MCPPGVPRACGDCRAHVVSSVELKIRIYTKRHRHDTRRSHPHQHIRLDSIRRRAIFSAKAASGAAGVRAIGLDDTSSGTPRSAIQAPASHRPAGDRRSPSQLTWLQSGRGLAWLQGARPPPSRLVT